MTAAVLRHQEPASEREPRWLVRRRAEAARAMVIAEAAPPEQACLLYGVTLAQFEACRRAAERYGSKGSSGLNRRFALRWPLRVR